MIKRSHTFLFFLVTVLSPALSQPDWRAIVAPAFEALDKEASDSIAACRTDAGKLRAEMDAIVASKALDRAFIFGKNDEYFKEGMHKNFKKPPVKMQVQVDRDKAIVRLENLHARLYERDATLFYWLGVQSRLSKYPDRNNYPAWSSRHFNLPASQRPDPQAPEKCRQWVMDELVCEMANARQNFSPSSAGKKVGSFDIKFNTLTVEASQNIFAKSSLPIPQQDLLCSFPVNGQFAFHPSESIPKVGYAVFPRGAFQPISELASQEFEFKARWTASNGEMQYTAAEYRFMEGAMFFNIPAQLDGGQIYRLQLVALPNDYKAAFLPTPTCWDVFRGKNTLTYQQKNATVAGEKLITELYFRAGLYDVREKMETLRGDINWLRGEVVFETDEPLDPFEMYGSGTVPATVTFRIQTIHFYNIAKAINSDQVLYYLTVPRVEPTENVPLSQWLTAELDNTLDASFIRKTSLGNAKGYRSLPDPVAADTPLPGNYMAPAFQDYKVEDSLITQHRIPFISKDHFDAKKRYELAPARCTLMIGELKRLVSATQSLQHQLKKRMEERVDFFFELEKRRALREGKSLTVTKEQLQQQELENLPKEVIMLLDAKIPESFQPNFSLIYQRLFPGTDRYNTSLELKFDSDK